MKVRYLKDKNDGRDEDNIYVLKINHMIMINEVHV